MRLSVVISRSLADRMGSVAVEPLLIYGSVCGNSAIGSGIIGGGDSFVCCSHSWSGGGGSGFVAINDDKLPRPKCDVTLAFCSWAGIMTGTLPSYVNSRFISERYGLLFSKLVGSWSSLSCEAYR